MQALARLATRAPAAARARWPAPPRRPPRPAAAPAAAAMASSAESSGRQGEFVNELGASESPYLRQHASNPVAWKQWGEAAFAKAKARGVPIFLSSGYAACHWCHVFAHESFENEETAALMNRDFVCIKIDKEVGLQLAAGVNFKYLSLYMDIKNNLSTHPTHPTDQPTAHASPR
jgi:hypothetical protein